MYQCMDCLFTLGSSNVDINVTALELQGDTSCERKRMWLTYLMMTVSWVGKTVNANKFKAYKLNLDHLFPSFYHGIQL